MQYTTYLLKNIKSTIKIKTLKNLLNTSILIFKKTLFYVEYLNKCVFDINFKTSTSVIFVFTL
jgi:hypothetical protein